MAEQVNKQRTFKSGDVIMRQGEKGESAFIIEEGKVEIIIERPGGEKQNVGTRGPGSIIGEMAIVDNAPRTATIVAVEKCSLLEITQEDFSRRLKNADPVLRMTTQVILTRYRDTLIRAEIRGDNYNWPPAEAVELGYAEETDAVENIKIANEFQAALENGDLSLHYQPIIDIQEGGIVGFEPLMRWEHAEKGFISPGIFIPIAEESGLIVEASKWALGEACMALKRIEQKTGRDGLYMSVNFSSRDFAVEGFVDTAYQIISKSDVNTSQIRLEITERLLMQQPDNARETLNLCRDAGMSIAIDDFGTGYSSLSYLHYFPIDTLKIDQSFVRDMSKNENSLELIKSIIALGQNLSMSIVAEGVEEESEAKLLKELNCEAAQGYYFARPLPEKEAMALLKDWQKVQL